MTNLDRYTVSALYLGDFLSDAVRQKIMIASQEDNLNELRDHLTDLQSTVSLECESVLRTNPAAMAKISADTRVFGFAESELSRRLNITDGEHTDKIIEICWDYSQMVSFLMKSVPVEDMQLNRKLTNQIYELAKGIFHTLVSSLVAHGCITDMFGSDRFYRFFSASAGQMRKQHFIMLRDDVYEEQYEAMTLGLTEEKVNSMGGINASKWLPYVSLCMSSSIPLKWFDIDRMIIIPDSEIRLTAMVDTVTQDYSIVRGERDDIKNPINDGIGFYWRRASHWNKVNLQIRYAFVKGLITPLNFVSLFRIYGEKPVLKDIWGTEHDLVKEGIEVILTESQFKMHGFFRSFEEYKAACRKHFREFSVLNQDGDKIYDSELSYQMVQSLVTATDAELTQLASSSVATLRSLNTQEGALLALGAYKASEKQNGFEKSLSMLPELLGDAYTKQLLADTYDAKYRSTLSGRLEIHGKYQYIVPDPIALFEACFLHRNPVGVLRQDEVWTNQFPSGHMVDVLRSPHNHVIEHCVQKVAPYRNSFGFMDSNAVYISVHSTLPMRIMCDYDGDIALVVDDKNLVSTAEHCIQDADAVCLCYDAQKAPKKALCSDALGEAIFRAHDFNRIGIYSIYSLKLLAGEDPDMNRLAQLTAASNFAVDAVKTGAMEELPYELVKGLRKAKKPYWWRYDHQTEEHPYTDSTYWDKELAPVGHGAVDRVGEIVRASVPEVSTLEDVTSDTSLWAKMCIDPKRKTVLGAVDVFKELARRNAQEWNKLFSKRPDLHQDWVTSAAIAEKKLAIAFNELAEAVFGDIEGAYDTITRGLFRYPENSEYKRFYWSLFGDITAEVIRMNLKKEQDNAA